MTDHGSASSSLTDENTVEAPFGGERSDDERSVATEMSTNVLQMLADSDVRAILSRTVNHPSTVPELIEACDIPTPTAYRKVNELVDVGLLERETRIHAQGKNINEYQNRVETIHVQLGDSGSPEVYYSLTSSDDRPSPRVVTDGGETDRSETPSQQQLGSLFIEIAGTDEVVEKQDTDSDSRIRDEAQSISRYVTSIADEDGLADSLPEPESDSSK